MITALIVIAVVVGIVGLVALTGRLGPTRLSGPDDRRDHTPPSPGGQGR